MRWLRDLWRRLERALSPSPRGRLFLLGMARADDADRFLARRSPYAEAGIRARERVRALSERLSRSGRRRGTRT